jgi:hypothetical protein
VSTGNAPPYCSQIWSRQRCVPSPDATRDTWVAADSPGDQSAAFQVAEAVRWTEKGLSGFFQFLNGIMLLALGVSIALGTRYPKWIGFVGALAGLAFVAGGTVTVTQASRRRRAGS